VSIAGATCKQHANEKSITHPTNNIFFPFLVHKFLIILPFSITPSLSLLGNFLDSFFFHLLGSMVGREGKGREGKGRGGEEGDFLASFCLT
jgi:hypothetical protein